MYEYHLPTQALAPPADVIIEHLRVIDYVSAGPYRCYTYTLATYVHTPIDAWEQCNHTRKTELNRYLVHALEQPPIHVALPTKDD